jgi:hypothetical protein
MRMCEYANNLIDMGILFYSIEGNRKIEYYATEINRYIVYEGNVYNIPLLFVSLNYNFLHMVFPKMFKDLDYIKLIEYYYTIGFEKSNEIDLTYLIIFGD